MHNFELLVSLTYGNFCFSNVRICCVLLIPFIRLILTCANLFRYLSLLSRGRYLFETYEGERCSLTMCYSLCVCIEGVCIGGSVLFALLYKYSTLWVVSQ